MAYTSTQFLLRFPEFGSIPAPAGNTSADVIQVHLDDMDAETSNHSFGCARGKAVFLQVAHALGIRYLINLAASGLNNLQNPGVASGKQVAGHSVSHQFVMPVALSQQGAGHGNWKAYYSRTTYGLQFLALCDTCLSKGVISAETHGWVEIGDGGYTQA
jgi:hypothetical protein